MIETKTCTIKEYRVPMRDGAQLYTRVFFCLPAKGRGPQW